MFDLKMDTPPKQKKYRGLVRTHGQLKVTSTIVRLGLFSHPVATWTELTRLSSVLTAEQGAVRRRVTTPRSAIARCATPRDFPPVFTPRDFPQVGTPTTVTPKSAPLPWCDPSLFMATTPVSFNQLVARKVFDNKKISKPPSPSPSPKPRSPKPSTPVVTRITANSPIVAWPPMSPLVDVFLLSPRIHVRVDPRLQLPSDSPSVTPRALTY